MRSEGEDKRVDHEAEARASRSSAGSWLPPRVERLIVLTLALVVLVAVVPRLRDTSRGSDISAAHFGTVYALVHNGTWALDGKVSRRTRHAVAVDGQRYSAEPPLIALLSAVTYGALRTVSDVSLETSKRSMARVLVNLVSGAGLLAIYLLLLWRWLVHHIRDPLSRLFTFAACSLGFFGAGYAVDANAHSAAMTAGMAALYLASLEGEMSRRRAAALGAAAGALATFAWTLAPLAFGLVAFGARRSLAAWGAAAAGAVVPLAVHAGIRLATVGTVLPLELSPELFDRAPPPGSLSWDVVAWHYLGGHQGVFSMVPLTAVALWGVGLLVKERHRLWPITLMIVVSFAGVFFYRSWSGDLGGRNVGPMLLIAALSLVLPWQAFVYERVRRPLALRWQVVLPVALALSSAHFANAAMNPWYKSWLRMRAIEANHDAKAEAALGQARQRAAERTTREVTP